MSSFLKIKVMIKKIFKLALLAVILAGIVRTTYGVYSTKANASVYSAENVGVSKDIEKHVMALFQNGKWRNMDHFDSLQAAAQYISDYLGRLGYEVELQYFSCQNKVVSNIIAEKKGLKSPKEVIIVGAHYDSYFTPGADRNASGVAALLELANAFSKAETGKTIRFVFFTNTEPPFFKTQDMGSIVFVKQLKESQDSVDSVFILDSVGYYSTKPSSQRYLPLFGLLYPNEGNFIALVANSGSFRLLRAVSPIFKKDISLPVCSFIGSDFVNSDHTIFWKEKFKTILITDTGSYRNPNFYSLSDIPETLNYRNIAQVVQGLAAVLKDLSG